MIQLALDQIMKERGLTQKDVVELTKLNRNTVKALAANASTRIDFPTLDALCKGLNVKPKDIIIYIEEDGSE